MVLFRIKAGNRSEDLQSERSTVSGTPCIRERRELWSMAVAALASAEQFTAAYPSRGSVLLLERNRETSTNLNARSPSTDRH